MLKLRLNKEINEQILKDYEKQVNQINKIIMDKTGPGNDFLGWVDWPVNYDKDELNRIKKDAQYVRDHFDILVVCGIGGSYLGSRCDLEALNCLKSDNSIKLFNKYWKPVEKGFLFDFSYTAATQARERDRYVSKGSM